MSALRTAALTSLVALCVSCSSSISRSEPPTNTDATERTSSNATDATAATAAPSVSTDATTAAPATTTAPAAALGLLNGDLEQLTDQLDDPAVADAARTVLAAGGAEPALRFAATYVLANVGDDPSLLAPLLTDADPTIALTAAIGVVAQGGREGFALLIAALTSTTALDYYGTGETAWSAATVALVQFTGIAANGPPFDADGGQLLLAQRRWQAWLDANAGSLTFDAQAGHWSTT